MSQVHIQDGNGLDVIPVENRCCHQTMVLPFLKLKGYKQIPLVLQGINFVDGHMKEAA